MIPHLNTARYWRNSLLDGELSNGEFRYEKIKQSKFDKVKPDADRQIEDLAKKGRKTAKCCAWNATERKAASDAISSF